VKLICNILLGLGIALSPAGICQAGKGLSPKDGQRALALLEAAKHPVVLAMEQNEIAILKAVSSLKAGKAEKAISVLQHDKDLENDPLAALIEAEAYRRQAVQAVTRAGKYADSLVSKKQSLETANLSPDLIEADVRLQAFIDKVDGMSGQPLNLLSLGSDVESVFLVDKARSRMFVYERAAGGGFKRIADEYVVTGSMAGNKRMEGDKRTPSGVYRFVKRLSGPDLNARYGPVAFPIDYPNALDRLNGKNGGGIWMHGYGAGVGRRPPRDTKGCFALPNEQLMTVANDVHLRHSWVVIGENLVFSEKEKKNVLLHDIKASLEAWRQDWESLDTDAYLRHYHKKFRAGRRNLQDWYDYKRRTNRNKRFIKVGLENFTIILDPNHDEFDQVAVAEFDQRYRSSNYADTTRKRLYLVRDSRTAPWQILIEEEVRS